MKEKQTMQVVIEEALKRRFKAACIMDNLSMSDVVTELVTKWLERRDRKKKGQGELESDEI